MMQNCIIIKYCKHIHFGSKFLFVYIELAVFLLINKIFLQYTLQFCQHTVWWGRGRIISHLFASQQSPTTKTKHYNCMKMTGFIRNINQLDSEIKKIKITIVSRTYYWYTWKIYFELSECMQNSLIYQISI